MVDRIVNFQAQEIRFLDETITIQGRVQRKSLESNWAPCSWSVICARTKAARDHMGNKRLRVLVDSHLEKYSNANRIEKGIIVSSVVDSVRQASNGGGFVKENKKTGSWDEVGCDVAREKVGQLLREGLVKKDPTKIQKRKEQRKAQKVIKAKRDLVRSNTTASSSDSSVSTDETSTMTTSVTSSCCCCSSSSVASESEAKPMPGVSSLVELLGFDSSSTTTTDDLFHPLPLESVSSTFVFDLEGFQF